MKEAAVSAYLLDNYDNYYETGDSEWRRIGAIDKAENIVALCERYPHDSILEIGAGEGAILKRLSELEFGNELHALEISASGVETIRRKKIPRLAECSVFDGYNTPYENGRFDLAVLSHVIEHVEHPRQLLYEAARIAKYVFVEVPLEDTLRLATDFVFDSVGHLDAYSPKTIRRLIQSCNLKVLDQRVTNPSLAAYTYRDHRKGLVLFGVKEGLRRLAPRLATSLFTYHASLVCTRNDASRRT